MENNNSFLSVILKSINTQKAYYVGGTLCVDFDNTVFMFNLNETVSYNFIRDKADQHTKTKLLGLHEVTLLFLIYLDKRIFNNEGNPKYFLHKLNESCIRHFLSKELLQIINTNHSYLKLDEYLHWLEQELTNLEKRFCSDIDKNQLRVFRMLESSTYGAFGKKLRIGDIMAGAEAIRKANENFILFKFAAKDKNVKHKW
jgi:hypothetical protein